MTLAEESYTYKRDAWIEIGVSATTPTLTLSRPFHMRGKTSGDCEDVYRQDRHRYPSAAP